jgi:hypothetical protein
LVDRDTNVADTFLEQAARLRHRYLTFYRRSIEEFKSEPGFAVELLVQPNGRTTPVPFCLTRIDIISGESDAPRVRRIADLQEEASSVNFWLPSGVQMQQHAFSWEALRLRFSGPQFKIESLQGWLTSWLVADEVREPDSSGLSGVVHDLAWATEQGMWQLDVDLGSAPIDALEDLLAGISGAGVTSVELSRHDVGDA